MSDNQRFSRIISTAEGLGAADFKPDRFMAERVLLTGTCEVLASANGAEMARCAVLLLMRITSNLTIALPEGLEDLQRDLRACARRHAWDEPPFFAPLPVAGLAEFAAILSIGGRPRPGLPLTVISSNGWLARVTSGASAIEQACEQANPVGALGAASLGVAEVFKRLLHLRPDGGHLLDACSFSFWAYARSDEPGPALPEVLKTDLLVAGAGAIGNGVVHLLTQLPLAGRCRILDEQSYADENWGTCLRVTRNAINSDKAVFLARLFNGPSTAEPIAGRVQDAEESEGWRAPAVVLNGFDNVEARYAAQDLWPDLIVDGAIGPKFECQTSAHPWASDIACLRCIFAPEVGEPAEVVQQRLTGLPAASLVDLSRPLLEEDVALADPKNRAWLSRHIGKPICSVLDAAVELAGVTLPPGFRPSVPFVATFSACMMVTELVRYLTTGSVGVEPKFFCSLLWGPDRGEHYPEGRRVDCICRTRSHLINRIRADRALGV